MANAPNSKTSLAAEIDRLRRRIAELQASAADHQRAEQQLERDARLNEAALRKSEDTARAVLESASEGIILINTTGRITLVNAAAERMFGYRRRELLDEPLEILLPERIRRSHVEHRTGYFAEPRVRPMGIGLDLSGRRKDGTEFPVEISLSHVESAGSLRSFARHTPGDRVPLDLNAIVEESLQLMQKPLAADNVQIVASLDRALAPILGDATTLHQVLMNLLTNAREAMPAGGQVRIETAPAERPGWIRLLVADTGSGIPAAEVSKIFDPFFTTKRTGTGLGLSVTYGIIQEHGGTVDVQSRPGAGTTFIVSFPSISLAAP